jgi:hypothetical protein
MEKMNTILNNRNLYDFCKMLGIFLRSDVIDISQIENKILNLEKYTDENPHLGKKDWLFTIHMSSQLGRIIKTLSNKIIKTKLRYLNSMITTMQITRERKLSSLTKHFILLALSNLADGDLFISDKYISLALKTAIMKPYFRAIGGNDKAILKKELSNIFSDENIVSPLEAVFGSGCNYQSFFMSEIVNLTSTNNNKLCLSSHLCEIDHHMYLVLLTFDGGNIVLDSAMFKGFLDFLIGGDEKAIKDYCMLIFSILYSILIIVITRKRNGNFLAMDFQSIGRRKWLERHIRRIKCRGDLLKVIPKYIYNTGMDVKPLVFATEHSLKSNGFFVKSYKGSRTVIEIIKCGKEPSFKEGN